MRVPLFFLVLLIATFGLTIWQARWAYFFFAIFALALPALLEPIKPRWAVWIAFTLSIFPILRDWDDRLWPNDTERARRLEQRNEQVEFRAIATEMLSSETRAFLAPWWISPRSHIGPANPRSPEVRTKVLMESRIALVFFSRKSRKQLDRFWKNAKSIALLATTRIELRRIPRPFWVRSFRLIHYVDLWTERRHRPRIFCGSCRKMERQNCSRLGRTGEKLGVSCEKSLTDATGKTIITPC